jgi:hypothetical protein
LSTARAAAPGPRHAARRLNLTAFVHAAGIRDDARRVRVTEARKKYAAGLAYPEDAQCAAWRPLRLEHAVPATLVLQLWQARITICEMKTLTVRLPDALVAEIDAESRGRKVSRSDIVRERLSSGSRRERVAPVAAIADLIGSVDGLPPDLSARTKHYLRRTGYGQKRPR